MSADLRVGALLQNIKAHWQRQGVAPAKGVSTSAVHSFESKYSVRLPPDCTQYFLELNGMDTLTTPPRTKRFRIADKDDEGFCFWPLDRVTRASDGEAPQHFDGAQNYFVFADYLDWSWAYAIRLSADGADNPVIIVGGSKDGRPLPLAENFSDFLELYLKGPEHIWIPSHER